MPRIKELLANGGTVRLFGTGQLISPKLIEIVGLHGGFDGLWLDFEHAGFAMRDIELATLAANAHGLDHFVRQPATDYATIMRSLEAGANGVMVSMVRSGRGGGSGRPLGEVPPEGGARNERGQSRRNGSGSRP